MIHISTTISPETGQKIKEIARACGFPPKRNVARVIEQAVDELHKKLQEQPRKGKEEG